MDLAKRLKGAGISGLWAASPLCTPAGFKGPGVDTALGCVPVQIEEFVSWLLPYLFRVAGGISFLLMVSGFISMATSGGDPKKVEEAKDKITSSITGLLISIFAMFLLKLIAIDVLNIPGMK